MYLSTKYELKQWTSFSDDIYEAFLQFFHNMSHLPKYITLNTHTYEQICFICSFSPFRDDLEGIEEGDVEINISGFANELGTLICDIDDELKDREFELIWDDSYDDDDDDDSGTEPEPVPMEEKEVCEV
jgi:hypothetical protein